MHLTLTTSNQQDQQLSILIRLLTRSLLHTCPSYLCIWRHRQTHTYTKSNLVRHQSFSCVCSRVLACLSCDKKRENKQIPQGGKVQGSSQPYPHSISLVWFVVGPCLISRHRSCLPKCSCPREARIAPSHVGNHGEQAADTQGLERLESIRESVCLPASTKRIIGKTSKEKRERLRTKP